MTDLEDRGAGRRALRLAADAVRAQIPLRNPLRHSPHRRLYTGLVLAALMVLPSGIGGTLLVVALVARAGLFVARRSPLLLADGRRSQAVAAADESANVPLGRDVYSGDRVAISDRALAAHGLVLGASGAGKTTTLLTLASRQIERNRPVIVIDLKGSPGFAHQLQHAAAQAGRGMTIWTLDGGSWWNPLAHGNATELKDKLIATERFSEPHYKRAAERYLQTAIRVLQEAQPERAVTLSRVVEIMNPQRLAAATAGLPSTRRDAVLDYLRSLAPDQLSAVRGLESRLALITESHTGQFLEPPARQPTPRSIAAGNPGASAAGNPGPYDAVPEQLDLRRALDGGNVVLLSLNSSSYGQLAGQLGTIAVQDLVTAAGARLAQGNDPLQATVVIDEFSALGSDNVLSLLARGRESGVGVLLATQELSDLDRAGLGFRDQVLGNTAVKIAHRQDVPESAAAVSRLAGTVKDLERTYTQRSGGGLGGRSGHGTTTRVVDRPVIEPSAAQSMRTGEAIVITKVPNAETHVTRIKPPRNERGIDR